MNENHKRMKTTVSFLESKGFRWNGQDEESVYLSRKRGSTTIMAQVDCFDGQTVTVNGKTLKEYMAWLNII